MSRADLRPKAQTGERQCDQWHLGPNGSSKSSHTKEHMGEASEIKGRAVSSWGASWSQDGKVSSLLGAASITKPPILPSTERASSSRHPRCYLVQKFSKRVPHDSRSTTWETCQAPPTESNWRTGPNRFSWVIWLHAPV